MQEDISFSNLHIHLDLKLEVLHKFWQQECKVFTLWWLALTAESQLKILLKFVPGSVQIKTFLFTFGEFICILPIYALRHAKGIWSNKGK